MIKLDQVILPIKYSDQDLIIAICNNLKVRRSDILSYEILKLSIDARKKPHIRYVASLGITLIDESPFRFLSYEKNTRTLSYAKISYGLNNPITSKLFSKILDKSFTNFTELV